MFIQTEDTPNPDAIKFFPGQEINSEGPIFFSELAEVKGKSKLAESLFHINNVKSVFFGSDFITVTKQPESNWQVIKPEILMVIMDHFVSGFPVFEESTKADNVQHNLDGLLEIEKQIIEIIETRVRPSVAQDGGDIIYKCFENGVVKLVLRGACLGCPSSTITLKNGIESMLKHFVPEVQAVEAVEEDF
ncbi:NifU family protein [Rickettsia canadensis]|uniref:NifU-like domain-containing protein n=1 Tax=Rickettsia canadensis str. CA410 TaxID=1105107 RepID=A0ABM5MT14_RICCA|nr:NifU family protein [Rickettsia canadensis]AFB21370.1 NifU-like domain-containing protein [Rickettsia canadensis str. CA410]